MARILGDLLTVIILSAAILTTKAQSGGAVGTSIPNSDPGIIYSPEVCTSASVTDCYGSWWDTTIASPRCRAYETLFIGGIRSSVTTIRL